MLTHEQHYRRGDTLVEVLFATAIFSLIAVGGLSIMNQGTAASQRALEVTLVRNEIDAQSETLRFLNSSYVAAYQPNDSFTCPYGPTSTLVDQWRQIYCTAVTSASAESQFGVNGSTCPNIPSSAFILDPRTAKFWSQANANIEPVQNVNASIGGLSVTYSKVVYNTDNDDIARVDGLWIQAVRATISGNNQDNADYIDFNIRACWETPGQSVPATIDTIVRLYEPR